MHALTWFDLYLRFGAGKLLYLLRENTGRIDDMARMHCQLCIAKCIVNTRAAYFTLLANKGCYFCIVGDRSPVLSSGTDKGHCEAGIIGLPIIVHVAVLQPLGNKGWSALQHSFAAQMTVPANVAPSRHDIIEEESHIEQQTQANPPWRGKWHSYRMTITMIMGQNKGKRLHQKRGVL